MTLLSWLRMHFQCTTRTAPAPACTAAENQFPSAPNPELAHSDEAPPVPLFRSTHSLVVRQSSVNSGTEHQTQGQSSFLLFGGVDIALALPISSFAGCNVVLHFHLQNGGFVFHMKDQCQQRAQRPAPILPEETSGAV
eukprot:TRINITY_DN4429_c0_g2_i5.p1 TRINITY_DN4429_c0_g2~~TRINITY_DN4429_c0_g2_i5.p1  ORF type:complete len:138 (+),score=14.62 TRINITY_DN4429_c0_g2_i5:429-842(+)